MPDEIHNIESVTIGFTMLIKLIKLGFIRI